MALIVNHNIPALQTYNAVTTTTNSLQKSIQKLSSGLRISSAADDAAGLAISEKMRAQVRGLDRAVANSQDGISMIQTAEGALSETHSILQRMRELSVQAANDTLTQQDRSYIQLEIDQLREEVTRIGNTTQFNKKKLLDGSAAVLWSSDKLSTKANINGGLRTIDQFGQKNAAEGNYKIEIKATPGQGEVKKTDEFKIKHKPVEITSASVDRKTPDKLNEPILNHITVKAASAITASGGTLDPTHTSAQTLALDMSEASVNNVSQMYLEVSDIIGTATAVSSFKVKGWYTKTDGTHGEIQDQTITGTFTEATKVNGTLNITGGSFKVGFTFGVGGGTDYTGAGFKHKPTDVAKGTSALTADDVIVTVGSTDYALKGSDVKNSTLKLHDYVGGGTVPDLEFLMPTEQVIKATANNATNKSLPIIVGTNKIPGSTVTYSAQSVEAQATAFTVTDIYRSDPGKSRADETLIKSLFSMSGFTKGNAALTFKVAQSSATGELELEVKGTYWDVDGTKTDIALKTLTWAAGGTSSDTLELGSATNVLTATNAPQQDLALFNSGDAFSVFFSQSRAADVGIEVTGTDGSKVVYNFDTNGIQGKNLDLTRYGYDAKGPEKEFGVKVKVPKNFVFAKIGDIATLNTKLRDIDKFWNSEGRFLLTDAQTLTITQGDGTKSQVTLYGDDTIHDMMNKLNNAIAVDLKQNKYVGDDANKFVTYTTAANAKSNVSAITAFGESADTAPGTFVIRSVVAGADGKLSFAGDEDLIKALSMNIMKEARESSYDVNVTDAHTGKNITAGKVTGNKLIGMVHENVDVVFDAMTGISAHLNTDTGYFEYNIATQESTILHLADNTTVFQIGANEGEDMGINIGDMRAEALGLTKVLVTDREAAARSITIIDSAIDKVSMQRAKIGAYQNRLEHTINNLTVAGENLTAAESRIRDTDMAKEMMNFTKLQIMLQAGTSMLAQANGLPQNVLGLLR
ncbi:MAG: flagellin [Synergistaceae bacterium]|jgi:flagellin|nr:flagellin [Synergistaceae bacterium]